MYLYGTKESRWILITDGIEIFATSGDIRKFNGYSYPNYRLKIEQSDLKEYCESNKISLQRSSGSLVKTKNNLIAGSLGLFLGFLGGPPGVYHTTKYFKRELFNDISEEYLEKIFKEAKRQTINNEQDIIRKAEYEILQGEREEEMARKNWDTYFRLRKFTSIDLLKGEEFELIIRDIYEKHGYKVTLTPVTSDYGVDVLAENEYEKLAIQVKRYSKKVGVGAIQEVSSGASYYGANKAIVVTNSYFTTNAIELAHKLNVRLIDRIKLRPLWEKVFPERQIPPYDQNEYRKIKDKIKRKLKAI